MTTTRRKERKNAKPLLKTLLASAAVGGVGRAAMADDITIGVCRCADQAGQRPRVPMGCR